MEQIITDVMIYWVTGSANNRELGSIPPRAVWAECDWSRV
jgi:hypothetical protein